MFHIFEEFRQFYIIDCGFKNELWVEFEDKSYLFGTVGETFVSSACQCEKICDANSDCGYWAYEKIRMDCVLMRSWVKTVSHQNIISGWGRRRNTKSK